MFPVRTQLCDVKRNYSVAIINEFLLYFHSVDADGNVVVEEEKKSKPFLSEDAPDAPQTENKEKTPPSPTTNLAPAKDLPPSYSNLELDELP